jgi:hypothetical protein
MRNSLLKKSLGIAGMDEGLNFMSNGRWEMSPGNHT